ncbi:MAG: DUF1127 domain-containing protein [Burkholderiales bacterium]
MDAFVETVAAATGTLRRWWLRRRSARAAARTREELHALSDHLLRDIGLERTRIDSLFR